VRAFPPVKHSVIKKPMQFKMVKIKRPNDWGRCLSRAAACIFMLLKPDDSVVERLLTILRIYIACGTVLYGDIQTADLITLNNASQSSAIKLNVGCWS
jgi:hypothetical protein